MSQNETKKPADGGSRRRVPRRPIHQKVGILIRGKYTIEFALEIGEGGLLIEHSKELKVNERLVLSLRLPGILSGVVLGTVAYKAPNIKARGNCYGVRFDDASFDLKRKIRNFVASNVAEITTESLADGGF
jgi:hypothetical protein